MDMANFFFMETESKRSQEHQKTSWQHWLGTSRTHQLPQGKLCWTVPKPTGGAPLCIQFHMGSEAWSEAFS